MKQLSLRTYVRGQCVFLNKVMFLKVASRLEASPELPPEALTPPLSPSPWPRRPFSEQWPPPLSPSPLPMPLSSALPPGSSQAPSSACPHVLLPAAASCGPVPRVCRLLAQPSAVLCRRDLVRGRQSHPGLHLAQRQPLARGRCTAQPPAPVVPSLARGRCTAQPPAPVVPSQPHGSAVAGSLTISIQHSIGSRSQRNQEEKKE